MFHFKKGKKMSVFFLLLIEYLHCLCVSITFVHVCLFCFFSSSEPFFYCKDGWNYTGIDDIRVDIVDHNYSNESFKQNVSFHCKIDAQQCRLTRIYYDPLEGRSGVGRSSRCSACTNSNQGEYFNFKLVCRPK